MPPARSARPWPVTCTRDARSARLLPRARRARGRVRARIAVQLRADRVPPRPVAPTSIEIHFLAAEGWSVVSDIDDTIRVSEVADRAALLRGTFVEPFEAVARMAGVYDG